MYYTCRYDFAIKRGPLIATKKGYSYGQRAFHCKLVVFICMPLAIKAKAYSRNLKNV